MVQHLSVLPGAGEREANAPPPRTVGFTGHALGRRHLLVEVFVPEVPERDDDGREGEAEDTPGLVFLAAAMVDLQEVAGQKETRVSGKREAGKDPDALVFRQHTAPLALRVSEV